MAQPELSTRKKLKVLIADDVQETRRNTRLMLATIDDVEVVAIASNGVQAVQFATEHHPDIVLLDVNMPGPDGYETCRRLKADAETSAIPVIFISGEGGLVNKVQAFASQINNFAGAIRGEEALLITAEDALASVEVIEAAYASAAQGRWVFLGAGS